MKLDTNSLELAARDARGLAMDAIAKCKSGHLGLPLGAADIGAVLYGSAMSFHPDEPRWLNRDRFILSAGHGSMFLYSWLHLSGFAVSLDDVKNFRVLHSITPGHPEYHETPGVEATTGPLGQGVSNAVGYAISAKMCEGRFNTPTHTIFDHHVFVLAGDGCLQEGVAQEASALAGHLGLDNLILIYDANNVTLDAMGPVSQSEDTAARYAAYGWEIHQIDGHDLHAIAGAIEKAKASTSGKPQLIIAKTIIGKGIPEVCGTNKAHGEAGVKFVTEARKSMGPVSYTHLTLPTILRKPRPTSRRAKSPSPPPIPNGRKTSKLGARPTPNSPANSMMPSPEKCRTSSRAFRPLIPLPTLQPAKQAATSFSTSPPPCPL